MSKKQGKKTKNQPRSKYRKGQPARSKGGNGAAAPSPPRPSVALKASKAPALAPSPVVSLEPLAPIVVRSGRPFDAQAGADGARFPPPSTLAGCLRTAWARGAGVPFGPELLERTVAGPLLARVDASGRVRLLAPRPADAHYFGHGDEARCVRAAPKAFDAGCDADLPGGLLPVQLADSVKEKPSPGPHWWDWEDLIAFRTGAEPRFGGLKTRGWSPPNGDLRTHAAIDPATGAAEDARLFQTNGLDLEPDNPGLRDDATGLRLLARCAEPLAVDMVHLGGERRLARLRPEPETAWPRPPADWFDRILQARGLTLTLLTPAAFGAGYRPGWLDVALRGEAPVAPGVGLRLVAAAVERWVAQSGWDLAAHKPRATRKLVAAGATYWLALDGTPDAEALASLWLGSLCDVEQDRRDGFGLALPAPWTPTEQPHITASPQD